MAEPPSSLHGPAREVKIGDELDIIVGDLRWTVIVRGLNGQRRPAPEVKLLYEETPESLARRAQVLELRKLAPTPGTQLKCRPTKRDGWRDGDSPQDDQTTSGRRVSR